MSGSSLRDPEVPANAGECPGCDRADLTWVGAGFAPFILALPQYVKDRHHLVWWEKTSAARDIVLAAGHPGGTGLFQQIPHRHPVV